MINILIFLNYILLFELWLKFEQIIYFYYLQYKIENSNLRTCQLPTSSQCTWICFQQIIIVRELDLSTSRNMLGMYSRELHSLNYFLYHYETDLSFYL